MREGKEASCIGQHGTLAATTVASERKRALPAGGALAPEPALTVSRANSPPLPHGTHKPQKRDAQEMVSYNRTHDTRTGVGAGSCHGITMGHCLPCLPTFLSPMTASHNLTSLNPLNLTKPVGSPRVPCFPR